MKLLQFPDNCHPKNKESMLRMCMSHGIDYEVTSDWNRVKGNDYDILWLPTLWIEPNELPNKKIIYGPQHFVFPDPTKPGICGPEDEELSRRSFYIALSKWVYDCYNEFSPWFKIPLRICPFGVKEMPARRIEDSTLDCILYYKRRDTVLIQRIQDILNTMSISYKVFTYGSYNECLYQDALQQTKCIVWLGCHESQGFAFQEALARNIPILVYDVDSMFDEYQVYDHLRGTKDLFATSASWWDDRCGEKIHTLEDLLPTLQHMLGNIQSYSPAAFVREHLSDKVCMERMLKGFIE